MNEENSKNVKIVSILGIIGNLFLVVIKCIIGVISKSQSMIADALHSGEDMLSSIVSFVGAKVSEKPCDEEHPFGHGKAEYIFSLVISILMIIASFTMVTNSIESIISGSVVYFSYWLIVVCIINLAIKIALYVYTSHKLKKSNDILIGASKEDHRNDIFVTIGTIIGVVFSKYGLGYIDGMIGAIISFWIGIIGIGIFKNSYKVLIDTNMSKETLSKITKEILENKDIKDVTKVIAKPIGQNYILIVKVLIQRDMPIEIGHEIGKNIKQNIMNKFEYIYDVIVHVNPS